MVICTTLPPSAVYMLISPNHHVPFIDPSKWPFRDPLQQVPPPLYDILLKKSAKTLIRIWCQNEGRVRPGFSMERKERFFLIHSIKKLIYFAMTTFGRLQAPSKKTIF